MRQFFVSLIALFTLVFLSSQALASTVTVTVGLVSGPIEASSSFSSFGANAISSIQNGWVAEGSPSTPSYVSAPLASATGKDFMASPGFNSWRGNASPSGNFAGENGTMLWSLIDIKGDGSTRFALNNLQWYWSDGESNGWFNDSGSYSNYGYGNGIIGVNYGADRSPGGSDNTVYTSGNGSTMVDEIIGVGIGMSLEPSGTGSNQQQLNDLLGEINAQAPFGIIAIYGLSGTSISGNPTAYVDVNSVPEPASLGLAIVGMILLVFAPRFRRARY